MTISLFILIIINYFWDMVSKDKLEKLRGEFNQMILTRRDIASEMPINYPTFTKFLNGKVGIAQENYDKCIAYLKRKGVNEKIKIFVKESKFQKRLDEAMELNRQAQEKAKQK